MQSRTNLKAVLAADQNSLAFSGRGNFNPLRRRRPSLPHCHRRRYRLRREAPAIAIPNAAIVPVIGFPSAETWGGRG